MMLQWKRPLESNGELLGYKIYFKSDDRHDLTFHEKESTTDSDAEQAKIVV